MGSVPACTPLVLVIARFSLTELLNVVQKETLNVILLCILDLGCMATSYRETKRCQVIDLVAEGVSEYVLDECRIPIYVCEWLVYQNCLDHIRSNKSCV